MWLTAWVLHRRVVMLLYIPVCPFPSLLAWYVKLIILRFCPEKQLPRLERILTQPRGLTKTFGGAFFDVLAPAEVGVHAARAQDRAAARSVVQQLARVGQVLHDGLLLLQPLQ